MIDKLKEVFKIDTYFDKLARNTYDSSATILLHKLFPVNTILSFTPYSLNPNTILHLINEIQINKRQKIIEFGSGISTIILGKFIKDNNLDSKIISIEDDEAWYNYIKYELTKYDLEGIVSLNYIPLKKEKNNTAWYDYRLVTNLVQNQKFDLIIVDGPSAKLGIDARKPVVEILINSFDEKFIIFLDDIRRKGEREILDNWTHILSKNNLNVKKEILKSKVYGTISCGNAFSSKPLSH